MGREESVKIKSGTSISWMMIIGLLVMLGSRQHLLGSSRIQRYCDPNLSGCYQDDVIRMMLSSYKVKTGEESEEVKMLQF